MAVLWKYWRNLSCSEPPGAGRLGPEELLAQTVNAARTDLSGTTNASRYPA